MSKGVLARYASYLPITAQTPMLSMGEGDTPLVRSKHIGDELGVRELYFKLEGCNPTGSFKDRGMVVAVAKAVEAGHRTILCASTGNTSASAAAYGAAMGIQTVVLVPKGDIAQGKLSQAIAYGARVVTVTGNFDQALNIAREMAAGYAISLVNSVNPHRIEGQKTGAFEIIDELGEAPDLVFLPVGNAGNITAYWRGFREYHGLGKAEHLPRMMGFQAEGAAPIVLGRPVKVPQTIASAIRIGNPASWQSAIEARDQSGGEIGMVSDPEILEAYRMLARQEGIFCEPASAASLAGVIKKARAGLDLTDSRAVCIITGHGLKDPAMVKEFTDSSIEEVPADLEAVAHLLNVATGTAAL